MSRSKQIGTAAESAVVKCAQALEIPARRVVLAGQYDQGDVHLWDGEVVIEVKSGKQTVKPSWNQIRGWYAEAQTESLNSTGGLPLLVLKRAGSGQASDWFAYWMSGELAPWLEQECLPEADEVLVSMRLEEALKVLTMLREKKEQR